MNHVIVFSFYFIQRHRHAKSVQGDFHTFAKLKISRHFFYKLWSHTTHVTYTGHKSQSDYVCPWQQQPISKSERQTPDKEPKRMLVDTVCCPNPSFPAQQGVDQCASLCSQSRIDNLYGKATHAHIFIRLDSRCSRSEILHIFIKLRWAVSNCRQS